MRKVLGVIVTIAGFVLAVYVGLWLMFIMPIFTMCAAFDAGTLSAMLVGICVVKILFASFVGWLIAYLSILIGKTICS